MCTSDLGTQRHPHALHQRLTGDERTGIEPVTRLTRRHGLERAQFVVCHTAIGPALTGGLADREPRSPFPRTVKHLRQHLGQHSSVVIGVMGLELLDAPMRGEGFQPQIGRIQVETPGQLNRAHHRLGGQLGAGQFGLRRQERVVEPDVMGDQCPASQQRDEVGDDIGELGLSLQHLRSQAVHVGGARINTRIQQTHHTVGDASVGIQRQRRDTNDTRPTWLKAGSLQVNHYPLGAVVGRLPPDRHDSGWHAGPTSRSRRAGYATPDGRWRTCAPRWGRRTDGRRAYRGRSSPPASRH